MRNVDVIVPVYKGLEETRACIETCLESCGRYDWFRLVVINDCSPEPELAAWLAENAAGRGFILLENRENLGFVASVNRGMQYEPEHDVLLLNSDVEVSGNWLERMRIAAYSRKTGSITPFSNNATICSFPGFCVDNQLFMGRDVSWIDRCFASLPLEDNLVPVPTGVGFCMYIRRDCLKEVGYFDVKNFGRGYGEENDWCQRAAKSGWPNYHQLNVFVYHKGGVSFQDEQDPRKAKALEILRRLHPDYDDEVCSFIQADPARRIRLQAFVELLAAENHARILFVSHGLGGGVVKHMEDLAAHYQKESCIVLLEPAENHQEDVLNLKLLTPDCQRILLLQAQGEQQIRLLLQLLRNMGISHIHYHHIMGWADFVTALPQLLGCSWTVTLHDYYFISGSPTLVDAAGRFAGEGREGVDFLSSVRYPRKNGLSGELWRERYRGFLEGAEHVISPSADVSCRFSRWYQLANLITAPHLENSTPKKRGSKPFSRKGNTLRVAVLGALGPEKGADLLERTAVLLKNAPIEFHLLGYGYRPLSAEVMQHGEYSQKGFYRLLEKVSPDVIWFPALWPETYSYTLSLAMESGIPVVAPDIGAFPERLAGYGHGAIVPWNLDPGEMYSYWQTVLEENDLYNDIGRLPENAERTQFLADHGFYDACYPRKLQQNRRSVNRDVCQQLLSQLVKNRPWPKDRLVPQAAGVQQGRQNNFSRKIRQFLRKFRATARQVWNFRIRKRNWLCVDSIQLCNGVLEIRGWAFTAERGRTVEILVDNQLLGSETIGLPRPDVACTLGFALADDAVGFCYTGVPAGDVRELAGNRELTVRIPLPAGPPLQSTRKICLVNEKLTIERIVRKGGLLEVSGEAVTREPVEFIEIGLDGKIIASRTAASCVTRPPERVDTPQGTLYLANFVFSLPILSPVAEHTVSSSSILSIMIPQENDAKLVSTRSVLLPLEEELAVVSVIDFGYCITVQGSLSSGRQPCRLTVTTDDNCMAEGRIEPHSRDICSYNFIACIENSSSQDPSPVPLRQIELQIDYADGRQTTIADIYCLQEAYSSGKTRHSSFGVTVGIVTFTLEEGLLCLQAVLHYDQLVQDEQPVLEYTLVVVSEAGQELEYHLAEEGVFLFLEARLPKITVKNLVLKISKDKGSEILFQLLKSDNAKFRGGGILQQ